MKISKKAQEKSFGTVITAILMLGLLGFGLWILLKAGYLGGEVSSIASPYLFKLCKSQGTGTDIDKDGFPDGCDNCVCETPDNGVSPCKNNEIDDKGKAIVTPGGKDKDNDGLPDICDEKPDDPTNVKFNKINCPKKDLRDIKAFGMQCRLFK